MIHVKMREYRKYIFVMYGAYTLGSQFEYFFSKKQYKSNFLEEYFGIANRMS
jgi:hypothetical protein